MLLRSKIGQIRVRTRKIVCVVSCFSISKYILRRSRGTALSLLIALFLTGAACKRNSASFTTTTADTSHAFAEPAANLTRTPIVAVRFLEARVKDDPDDIVALNKLSAYYLQLNRETADVKYLELALRSARASVRVLGPDQNIDGLLVLAQAEYQVHNFVSARDHAAEFIEYKPDKSAGYQVLGDAQLELGDYDKATASFNRMEELDRDSVGTETRMARLAFLQGDGLNSQRRLYRALKLAKLSLVPSVETIAWCQWQLAELAFTTGDYANAENYYAEALKTFPDYYRALAGLGKVRAARGDLVGAIEHYQHAIRIIPDPGFIAALGDLYQLLGKEQEATLQYQLVAKIGRLNALNGQLYNRQLASFQADHDLAPNEAYLAAQNEYAVRRDVFGADVLAWTALKAGKIGEARRAIKEALRLGTKEARLFYHAGMIARAGGDNSAAQVLLKQALDLNPQFDLLQARIAGTTLAE